MTSPLLLRRLVVDPSQAPRGIVEGQFKDLAGHGAFAADHRSERHVTRGVGLRGREAVNPNRFPIGVRNGVGRSKLGLHVGFGGGAHVETVDRIGIEGAAGGGGAGG